MKKLEKRNPLLEFVALCIEAVALGALAALVVFGYHLVKLAFGF